MVKIKFKKGFTVIELIVIMGVMAILVFLGSLAYNGYTKQARLVQLKYDARVLTDACERYFVDMGDYPRLLDTPYTSDQVSAFAAKVYDNKGAVITLDSSGKYYDLDYSKLKRYAAVKEDYKNFILQNPVGEVFVLDPQSNTRTNPDLVAIPGAPTITVDTTNNPPAYNVIYPDGVTPQVTEYQLDGGTTVTSAPVDLLAAGSHNIKVRYMDNNVYSDWASVDFTVVNGVKQISSGSWHSVALMQDGTVKAWGSNLYGQLGTTIKSGTTSSNPVPTTISGLSGVKQIVAGGNNTMALMEDGTVKAWGWNNYGQLGTTTNNNNSNPNPTPTTIPGLSGVKQIGVSSDHTLVLMNDGTVKAFGMNYYGQLGISATGGTINPNPVPTTIPGLSGVKQVAIGDGFSTVLMDNGTVKTFGHNYYGQLGYSPNAGTYTANVTPQIVPGLSGVVQISAGSSGVMALLSDGTVKAWGTNGYGQLGTTTNVGTNVPYTTPTAIPGLSGVKQVVIGNYNSIVLMNDGTIKAFGQNQFGQLGSTANNGTSAPNSTPTTVSGISGVTQIAVGAYHTVILMNDGTVKSFGRNDCGQLGITTNSGTTAPNPVPTTISGL